MAFKPRLSIGNIFRTPSTYEGEDMELVIALEPSETLPQMNMIILCPLQHGRAKKLWHVAYGRKIINCMITFPLTVEQMDKCDHIDSLSDDKIDELLSAQHWAEQLKMLGY